METVISKIAEHGVLGLITALTIAALYKMFKLYEDVQEKRIEEGLAYQADSREITQLLKNLTDRFHEVTEEIRAARPRRRE